MLLEVKNTFMRKKNETTEGTKIRAIRAPGEHRFVIRFTCSHSRSYQFFYFHIINSNTYNTVYTLRKSMRIDLCCFGAAANGIFHSKQYKCNGSVNVDLASFSMYI